MMGPPVLRLTHGTLYQNVPFVCMGYNLSYDPKAGFSYKNGNQISRRVKVELTLEEFRTGDFRDYNRKSRNIIDRDNNAGWEAIIEHSTYDPGK